MSAYLQKDRADRVDRLVLNLAVLADAATEVGRRASVAVVAAIGRGSEMM